MNLNPLWLLKSKVLRRGKQAYWERCASAQVSLNQLSGAGNLTTCTTQDFTVLYLKAWLPIKGLSLQGGVLLFEGSFALLNLYVGRTFHEQLWRQK